MTYLLMALLGLLAFAMVLSRTDYKAELLAVSLVAASLIALADGTVFGTPLHLSTAPVARADSR